MELGWAKRIFLFNVEPRQELQRLRQATAMRQLFTRHERLQIPDLLTELEFLRNSSKLDIMVEQGVPFFRIANNLFARSPLAANETSRLVAMLTWDELRKYPCRAAAIRLIRAIGQNPWNEHVMTLMEHRKWLEEEEYRTEDRSYRKTIRCEMRIVEDLIQTSRMWEVPKHGDVIEQRLLD
jgi:hypothetical protein